MLEDCRVDLRPTFGQCFLLYVVASHASDKDAGALARDIFGFNDPQYRKDVLLGSPIWEFVQQGISHYVWIRSSNELDNRVVQHILAMLCGRAKINYMVDQAAKCYQEGFSHYQTIEQRLGNIRSLLLNDTSADRAHRIQGLENHLSALPPLSHSLAGAERDLDIDLLGIKDNQHNAQRSFSYLPAGDTFLNSFFTEDCTYLIQQIQHNLTVLSPGRRYADQAIETIRAMVTLDSQKQQLELEKQETEREQKLRETLTILGTGLTISGLAASSRSRPTEKLLKDTRHWYSANPSHPPIQLPSAVLWLTNIGVFAGIGVGAALILYLCWSSLSKVCVKVFGNRR